MVKSTGKEVFDIMSGDAPLIDENGKVIIDAKPTARSMPSGLEAATILRDAYGNVIGGGPITWNNAYENQKKYSPIGDYTYSGSFSTGATVMPNTKTDIVQQYIKNNARNMQGLSLKDWFNAASKGVLAAMGMPTNDATGNIANDILGTVGTTIAGTVMKGNPVTRGLWVLGNVLDSLSDARGRAVDDFYSQEVEYDLAGLFETDASGKLVFRPDYAKMGDAGPKSGSGVLKAQDTTNTKATMNGDNNLVINVSPVFAKSDAYKELLEYLEGVFPSLTEESANEVVNEEKGATRLDYINALVRSWENEFLYDAQAVASIKEKAPTASDKAIDIAVDVSKVGYQNEKELEAAKITVYNEQNKKEEINAKKWLDSIAAMDKVGRENYMLSLGNRVVDDNISDDEKAVLYAQSMALYAASDGNGAYKGMYQKDWADAIGSANLAMTGLSWNKLTGGTELTTFRDNELASGLFQLGTTFGSAKALTGATNLIEKGFRKATPGISKWAGKGFEDALKSTDKGASVAKQAATIAGKTATQFAYQLAADAVYDAAKLGIYAATGNGDDYNFLEELSHDALMDMLVTYGPSQFVGAMNRPKNEYRVLAENTKTGEQEYKRYSDIKDDSNYKVILDEVGQRTVKLVEVTADELVARRIETIEKIQQNDNKLGRWVQKTFFDKNASMQRLALDIRKKYGVAEFRKFMRYAQDIRTLTEEESNKFTNLEHVKQHREALGTALKNAQDNGGKLKKADWNYIKAVVNESRFLAKQEGDEDAENIVKDFYSEAKNGVSAERAEQLNGIMESMRVLTDDVLDYMVDQGLVTKERATKIRQTPGAENLYIPMYTIKGSLGRGGDISQEREVFKHIKDPSALIALNKIADPLVSMSTYMNNAMRAVALNNKKLAVRAMASTMGLGIKIQSDEGGILRDAKNLKKMNADFDKIFKNIAAETRERLPSYKDWQATNDGLVLRSKAYKTAQELSKLREQTKQDQYELRKEKRRKNPDMSKIFILENKVQEGKAKQAELVNNTKRYIGLVMERAQEAHKGSDIKLNIENELATNITNALKKAIKSDNMVGEVQKVINDAVEKANPWVDPETVIMKRAEAAAYNFRKKVVKDMESQKKELGSKFDMAVDKVMDTITDKLLKNEKAEVTFIDDEGAPTKILDNYGQKNVIRYMLNGEEQRMSLTGEGAEELVAEFYAPEFRTPTTKFGQAAHQFGKIGNAASQTKRYLTTVIDTSRVLPNLVRDWSRGIVTTGGQILISPKKMLADIVERYNYGDAEKKKIVNGIKLAEDSLKGYTFTASMQVPSKNRNKAMVEALVNPDGNAFTRFVYDVKHLRLGALAARPQDWAETYTRRRAMDTAYYKELADSQAMGLSLDESIGRATDAAYFYGREATVNFSRRGALISRMAQQVPYLTQKFASYESFKLTFVDNPIAVTRSLQTTVSLYASFIAVALASQESREKYFMLSEYDRANNIIIPLDDGTIMTLPLDDTMAKFLTPYRRLVETLNGVDPESFYLIFADALDMLTPSDLSGFSEGDKFNIARGFEKLGAEAIPTWAQPFIEKLTGRDLYYGTDISVDATDTGMQDDNWTPTPGELTRKSKNSEFLKNVANATGIPQWELQNFLAEYGGNIGQYALETIDKLSGASEDAQGGKSFMDAIFKPFTGNDSNQVENAFYEAVNSLKMEKEEVQRKIATITQKINGASGNEKAELMNQRQKIINDYGLKVSDTLTQYLSAYEITGGLPKSLGNQAWYLYKLYDTTMRDDMILDGTSGELYNDKATDYFKKEANSLAALSGFDSIYHSPSLIYKDLYAEKAFKDTVNGFGTEQMAALAQILEDTSDYDNSFVKLRSDVNKARKEAYDNQDWDTRDALAYNYDMKLAMAIYPYLAEHGVAETLNRRDVMDYLKKWFIVPSEEQRDAKGRYVPNLGEDSEKTEAFKKQFIKKIFGVSGK